MRILTEEKLLIELKQKAFNLNIGVRSLEIPTPNPIFAFFFCYCVCKYTSICCTWFNPRTKQISTLPLPYISSFINHSFAKKKLVRKPLSFN